jgi:hypothetical protein
LIDLLCFICIRYANISVTNLRLCCFVIAEASISLENLKVLFTRPIFIIYFSALNILTFSGLMLAIWCHWAISDESKRPLFVGMSPKKMRRMVGLMFSLDGGLLASETLLLAKSG